MKVKITQDFKTSRGILNKDDVVSVKPAVAEKWQSDGLARAVK